MTLGPGEVEAAAGAAVAALTAVLEPSAVAGSRGQWASVAGSLQRVIDTATAAQDAAIARLAAIEPEYREDGTEVESHRALGHEALDAPAILSGVLAISAVHAQRRVRAAVRLAADGPGGARTETGLSGLHTAMGAGRLDSYRASVVAEELEAAPPQVAASVVAALQGHFEVEDAAHLRRRCRRVLARISPDLLRQRAVRARAACGLRRWAEEPGVDRWEGTFPSEEAARAWAAVDALAQRYVTDGVVAGIERARGMALTDLVAGHATIEAVLTVTVPAAAVPIASGPRSLQHERPTVPSRQSARTTDVGTAGSRVTASGRDHVVLTGASGSEVPAAAGDLVEVTGPNGNQPVLVSRTWVLGLASGDGAARAVEVAPCHPVTGALLDPDTRLGPQPRPDSAALASARAETMRQRSGAAPPDAYRPPRRLAKLVRARDRRCRFPGCTVAAVFCDLDHVRPWPTGPTTDTNLICLCRRHHRVKQRPGWHAALTGDGILTWTDPTGTVRTTHPADALTCTILTPAWGGTPEAPDQPHPHSKARAALPDGPHSALEFHLERHIATPHRRGDPHSARWVDGLGHRHRTETTPPATTVRTDPHTPWPHRRHRENRRHRDHDPPPF